MYLKPTSFKFIVFFLFTRCACSLNMVILENYFSSVLLSFPFSWADSYCLMLRETLARAPSPHYCGLTRNRGRTQGLMVEHDSAVGGLSLNPEWEK